MYAIRSYYVYNNAGGDYSGVQASPSDITADPQYADRDKHDYHLKSKAGRWNGSSWVNDNISSPCIDAGYSFSDYSYEPEPNGNRINIGPYGNTKYSSKSEFEVLNNSNNSSSDNSSDDSRITSYNVCYTKLLRCQTFLVQAQFCMRKDRFP